MSVTFEFWFYLMVEPANDLDLDGWNKIRSDIRAAFSGLYFICYLPKTFEDPDLVQWFGVLNLGMINFKTVSRL